MSEDCGVEGLVAFPQKQHLYFHCLILELFAV